MKLKRMELGPLMTNCYIVSDDNGVTAVIDPGARPEMVISYIEENNLELKAILLTHAHFDHTGGLKGLKERYPDAKVVIGKLEAPTLVGPPPRMAKSFYGTTAAYEDLSYDVLVSQGDVVEVGDMRFVVYDTPGHTIGGVCYVCGDLLFSGDTLFLGSIGRTDLEGGDYQTLLNSVKKLSQLEGDYKVLPGHEDASTLSWERAHNPYIREAMRCD